MTATHTADTPNNRTVRPATSAEPPATRIRPALSSVLKPGLIGLFLGGLAAVGFEAALTNPVAAILIAAAPGIPAGVAIVSAWNRRGGAPCPACHGHIARLRPYRHGGVDCPHCQTALRGTADAALEVRPLLPAIDPAARTPIGREYGPSGLAIAFAAVLVLGAVYAYLAFEGGLLGGGVVVVAGVIALGFAGAAVTGTGRGRCPSCDAPVPGLDPDDDIPLRACTGCGLFVEGVARAQPPTLCLVEPDRVADEPIFAVPLRDGARFPRRCAATGSDTPTHTVPAPFAASIKRDDEFTPPTVADLVTAPIAHVAGRSDGAIIYGTQAEHLRLAVCSYRYALEYSALNEVHPVAPGKADR